MSPFEYLLTFLAIILGLGIADMLQSLHRLLVGPRIKWHWMPPLWAAAVFLTILAVWIFNFEHQGDTGSLRYIRGSVSASLLFLISSAALPDVETALESKHPLLDHFEARWRYIAILWTAFLFWAVSGSLPMLGWQSYEVLGLGVLALLFLPCMLTGNVWYHTGISLLLIANALIIMFR